RAFRIDAGGPGGAGWRRDTAAAPSPYVDPSATRTARHDVDVDLTHPSVPEGTPESLFDTERWATPAGDGMRWSFPAAPGSYTVRLYLAETFAPAQAEGARVFDVSLEGSVVLDDVDVYAEAGPDAALVEELDATVTDGSLDLGFHSVVQNPSVKAIEVLPAPGALPARSPAPLPSPAESPPPAPGPPSGGSAPSPAPSPSPGDTVTSTNRLESADVLEEGLKEPGAGLYLTSKPPSESMSFIDHMIIGATWAELEPADGSFSGPGWTRIDSMLSNHPNMKFRLRIMAGRFAPSWLKKMSGPALSGSGRDCSREGGIAIVQPSNNISSCVPYFWRDVALTEYEELMAEVARRYEAEPRVLDVVNSACMTNWAEPFIRAGSHTASNTRLWRAGLNETTDRRCLERSMEIHDRLFARTRVSLATHVQWQIIVDPATDSNGVAPSWDKERVLLDGFRSRYGAKLVVQNNGLGGNEGCASGDPTSGLWCWMKAAATPKGFQTEGDSKLSARGYTVGHAVQQGIAMGACFVEHNQFGTDATQARSYDEQLKANCAEA
ncbi:MAG TPA: malectin domain-containing carbohydrate-binding protein, partial [Actinomycetota bacterium]|nr:malectin domain-containing carbohydrate-binding protein [Actinomycetota bacterium]